MLPIVDVAVATVAPITPPATPAGSTGYTQYSEHYTHAPIRDHYSSGPAHDVPSATRPLKSEIKEEATKEAHEEDQ